MELRTLDTIPTAVLLTDGDGNIQFANSAFKALMGFPEDHPYTGRFEEIFHKSSQPKIRQIWPLLNNRSNSVSESSINVRRKSGKRAEVSLTMKWAVGPTGEVIVATFHDLTELRRAQRERENAIQEIHRMSKLADIGKLSTGIAHEMNNPLMIIRGVAESLQHDLSEAPAENPIAAEKIKRILQATDRMSKITTNMMRMARDEDPNFKLTDLAEVVQEGLVLLKPQLQEEHVDLEVNFSTQHRNARCEPSQISQILINIVQNALHALSKVKTGDKKIRIEVRPSDESEAVLQLGIWNNGPPIPEKLKGHIMTPFFTTKPSGEGVGLGLAICQGIMDQHGGRLFFTSDATAGTEFVLEFPLATSLVIPRNDKPLSILVIDDEAFIADLLRERFNSMGHRTQSFTNPQTALEAAARGHFHLAFVDLRMPEMEGWDVLEKLSENKDLTLYAMSGYSATYSSQKISLVQGLIQKPFDMDQLAKILHEEVQRRHIAQKSAS